MNVSLRFNNAVSKLYKAFNEHTLNPEDIKQCAVGNILDNTDTWQHLTQKHGSLQLSYVGLVNENFGKRFNGYSPLELLHIETVFLKACGYKFSKNNKHLYKPEHYNDKTVLFKGMEAVIALLCQLDGVKNVMDYTHLFKEKPYKSIQSKVAIRQNC